MTQRPSGRAADQLRPVTIEPHVNVHAEGSCLITAGHTKVLCTASVEDRVPHWLKESGEGWVTAEYGMLPRATGSRSGREAARGKQSGRTQEIQRLIGRSLRAVTDLPALKGFQITVDCDVIQADGGTRCASITGGYVALRLALEKMVAARMITRMPLTGWLAAVSCGIWRGGPVLDLDYAEDSTAEADANFILTDKGGIVEIQATAEEEPFAEEMFMRLLTLGHKGVRELVGIQQQALKP